MLPKTDLCFIEGSLTGLKYAGNILHSIVRPIAGAVGEVFIFIDDNARFHRARIPGSKRDLRKQNNSAYEQAKFFSRP